MERTVDAWKERSVYASTEELGRPTPTDDGRLLAKLASESLRGGGGLKFSVARRSLLGLIALHCTILP